MPVVTPWNAARLTALLVAILALAAIAAPAQAEVRLTQDASFNARAWTLAGPDADGIRYIGGDFTSYKAWRTGYAGVFDTTTGALDTRFPQVSGWPFANAAAPDGSGGWYMGGTRVTDPVHYLADGSTDPAFSVTTDSQDMLAMTRVGDVLLLAGYFNQVNGVTRHRLAAVNATTGALLDWNPNAGQGVRTMVVVGNTVYVGGQFTSMSGQARSLAAAVRIGDRTGGASGTCVTNWDDADCLTAWDPQVGGWGVKSIAVDSANHRVFLSGAVSSIGGAARGGVGAVDDSTGALDSWDPSADSEVTGLAILGDKLYTVGYYSTISGTSRSSAAAYNLSDLSLASWNPGIIGGAETITASGSTLYVGGAFTRVGTSMRSHAAAIGTDGVVSAWDPRLCDNDNGSGTHVYGIAVSGSQAYVLGDFPCAGGEKKMHTAAIGRDGILTDWEAATDGPVYSFSRLGSTIYMAGNFLTINGVSRQRAAAVTTDGTVTAWNPDPGGDRPVTVIATADRVYLGGFFGTMNGGTPVQGIAAVDPTTGALDAGFNVGIDGHVRGMALMDGKLYIGGGFSLVGAFDTDPSVGGYEVPGTARSNVAAVDAVTGALDAGFQADTDRVVEGVAADPTRSRVILGGEFDTINGTTRRRAAAVNAATGALDASWNPSIGSGGPVYSLAVTPDTIYIGGYSNMCLDDGGGVSACSFVAVDPTTGLLGSWRPQIWGGEQQVRGISVSDAAIFIAGSFDGIDGDSRKNAAAIGIDGTPLAPWPMDPSTTQPLEITMAGTGDGQVVSDPGGILCGGSCAYGFETGGTVELTAVAPAGTGFAGWGGACSGTATTCTVTMSAARSVTATFGDPGSGGGSGGDSGGGAGESGAGLSSADVLSRTALSVGVPSPGGVILLPLTCPAGGGTCTFSGVLSTPLASTRARAVKRIVLGRFAKVRVAAGRTRVVKVRLSPALYAGLQARGVRRVRTSIWIGVRRNGALSAVRVAVWVRIPARSGGGITG